jgi:hypothetical protein
MATVVTLAEQFTLSEKPYRLIYQSIVVNDATLTTFFGAIFLRFD